MTEMERHLEWQVSLEESIGKLLSALGYAHTEDQRVKDTPCRVVRAFIELTDGVGQDPSRVLDAHFSNESYNEIILVKQIDFHSLCEHHLLPFHGMVHFGYLPDKRIVGLSKIPRMIGILAHRPQVQERLTCQIVDIFQEHLKPKGCAVVVEAWHSCASIRGVCKAGMRMRTQALRGIFLDQPHVKAEFLASINGRE